MLLHYALLAALCWMLAEAIQLYLAFVTVFPTSLTLSSQHRLYCLLGWVAPGLVVTVSAAAALGNYGSASLCWIDPSTSLVWGFLAPAGLVLTISTGMWIRVLIAVKSASRHGLTVRACVALGVLVGVSWLTGGLVAVYPQIALQALFVLLNSSQGVSIVAGSF